MKREIEEQELIETLKNMPEVSDETDKALLFSRVSQKINQVESRKPKRRSFVPLYSLATVFIVMLIILPFLRGQSGDLIHDHAVREVAQQSHLKTIEYAQEESAGNASMALLDTETRLIENSLESHVLETRGDHEVIIHTALADSQGQYMVPLALIMENDGRDMSAYYNHLVLHLDHEQWGLSRYPLDETTFEINRSAQEVTVTLPEDFTLGDGSTAASLFERTLAEMFLPHDIQRAIFTGVDQPGAELGPFGFVTEMALLPAGQASYKVYQLTAEHPAFLVPIPHEEVNNLAEAFALMRINEPTFHISQSIPDNVSFELTTSGRQIIIRLSEETVLEDSQVYHTMIEAMLLTAKNYDYDHIVFKNTNISQIGQYDLEQAIAIPVAVNPVYIMEE